MNQRTFAMTCHHRPGRQAALLLAVGALLPTLADAQTTSLDASPSGWRYSATIYAYLPTIGGKSSVPADSSGTPINIDASKILDSLKFTFMGNFDAHNGRWGVFTDVLYLDLGNDKQQSTDFTVGNVGLPVGATADLGLDLKGLIWTLAGQYRIMEEPAFTLDALGGARWLDLRTTTRWNITGNLGPITPPGRSGVHEGTVSLVDAIVGVKGRAALDAERRWSVPFYLDVGTGQSDFTWQAAAGVSYGFKWGDVSLLWRYLAYDMKSSEAITNLHFSGPMIGATFRW
jgi:hypothetical protein